MADSTGKTLDDVYDDPDNILADDEDDVDGAPDKTPPSSNGDLSESIYNPEKDTTDLDDRGGIAELDGSDADEDDEQADGPDPTGPVDDEDENDPDSLRLGDVHPMDEEDGTER